MRLRKPLKRKERDSNEPIRSQKKGKPVCHGVLFFLLLSIGVVVRIFMLSRPIVWLVNVTLIT